MPSIESKFDWMTLTPYSFSNPSKTAGATKSAQLKYTRSPSTLTSIGRSGSPKALRPSGRKPHPARPRPKAAATPERRNARRDGGGDSSGDMRSSP